MLTILAKEDYTYKGSLPNLPDLDALRDVPVGDIEVEMQWFTRRPGDTVVVGVDKALAMLKHCTGYFDGGEWVDTSGDLEVHATHDGSIVRYRGNPLEVQPVLRVRGRYRDFAIHETATLGILTRASRVATNVYQTMVAARGKPVLFFPARFDLHEVQAADGYAYDIGVERFNMDYAHKIRSYVSTDAQGDWWGGAGGGTVAHAAIASFLGDTAEAMCAFATTMPADFPRIALVDFNNDSVADSLAVIDVMFSRYRELIDAGDEENAQRYVLYGVRLDTSGSLRDVSVPPLGDVELDMGVNPRLVFIVRQALDNAWVRWDLPAEWIERAKAFCEDVKIVVTGGFKPEKINRFEALKVPVDIYGVGSSLFTNCGDKVTDFTADVVRVKVNGEWVDMAKVGRAPGKNPELERVW